ncbi:aldo/keto reductase [Chloroflexia bacterium SDU3-3]|nr:aldo/keto reductase [Chloroflexia bacterium SDU3-3]
MANIPSVQLNNGVTMPQLGLGVYLVPDNETAATVAAALELGYRLIDTAAAYQNEEGVGQAVRASGIPRDEIFVTTKLWNAHHGYDKTLRAFDESLRKLGLDYVDLYLIHWPLPMKGLAGETWRALERIAKEGRARAIGLSNFTPAQIDQLLAQAEITPAALQIELHPTFNQPDVRKYASQHGITIESWYPLGGQRNKDSLLALPLLADLGKKYGKSPAQIVLRWHTQLGLVVIPKSSNPGRIKENSEIFDFTLAPDEVAAISALDTGVRLGPNPDTASFE